MDENQLRDLKQKVDNLEVRWQPVSTERINNMWSSVRETMDKFTSQLVQAELDRRGLNDTVAKLLAQHRQMEVIMAAHAVQLSEMQEQVNVVAVALDELRNEMLE